MLLQPSKIMGWYLRSWKGCKTNCPAKKISKDKKSAWLGQPHLIKNMEKKFGECMHGVWSHETPGMPKSLIVRPMVDNEKISAKDHWEFWLGVDMLLYLVKHPQSKANNGANPAAYKELP